MLIYKVEDKEFLPYGKVITGLSPASLLKRLDEISPKPKASVVYVPDVKELDADPIAKTLSLNVYGGMPIQIGYCNGDNTKLNCLEYHRGSEINIPSDDMVLLLALITDFKEGKLDTAKVKAFFVPRGTIVQIYETSLHYAPCNGNNEGFRVIIVLPKGTNSKKPDITERTPEDKLLWACNKWLIAHPDSAEAKDGAYIGLVGKNIDITQ